MLDRDIDAQVTHAVTERALIRQLVTALGLLDTLASVG
jgi:hypothetical protein